MYCYFFQAIAHKVLTAEAATVSDLGCPRLLLSPDDFRFRSWFRNLFDFLHVE